MSHLRDGFACLEHSLRFTHYHLCVLLLEVSADIKIIYLISLLISFPDSGSEAGFCVRFMILELLVSLTFSAGRLDCKYIDVEALLDAFRWQI